MGTRWRKVRSDLLFNKSLSALAIVSLAVGTLAVGAMYLAATSVSSSFEPMSPKPARLRKRVRSRPSRWRAT